MLNPDQVFVSQSGNGMTRAQVADQVNGDLELVHVNQSILGGDDRLTDTICQRYANIVVGSDSELEEVASLLEMMGFISGN
jgi:hypothetical protein